MAIVETYRGRAALILPAIENQSKPILKQDRVCFATDRVFHAIIKAATHADKIYQTAESDKQAAKDQSFLRNMRRIIRVVGPRDPMIQTLMQDEDFGPYIRPLIPLSDAS